MNLRNPTRASWRSIDLYVKQDRKENPWFWERIDARHFVCDSLDYLLVTGLKLEFLKLEAAYGYAHSPDRETIPRKHAHIQIHSLLGPYNRDKTLFHELMHIWHGYPLDDGVTVRTKERRVKNSARVEWLCRQSRADPAVLSHTIERLRVQPWIYDQASYDAFHTQCKYPGAREDYCRTRMD